MDKDHGPEHASRLAVDRQREHFNSIAARYQTGRKAGNHLHLKKLIWENILGDVAEFRGRHIEVLEPMCGFADGYEIVKTYLSDDVAYSGYDYSDTVIDMLKSERPELNVWQADAGAYNPPENKFDVVILIGGLHHVPQLAREIVARTTSALKPGGLFINFEPTFGNPALRMVREYIYRKNSLFDEQTERSFDVADLLGMFTSAGLSPRKIRYPGLLSYILYYNPDAFPALNIGSTRFVDATFALDRLIYKGALGSYLSFATLSLWEKPHGAAQAPSSTRTVS